MTSCASFSASSALEDRWLDGVLDAMFRSPCGQSVCSFLISCLAMTEVGDLVSSF